MNLRNLARVFQRNCSLWPLIYIYIYIYIGGGIGCGCAGGCLGRAERKCAALLCAGLVSGGGDGLAALVRPLPCLLLFGGSSRGPAAGLDDSGRPAKGRGLRFDKII